MLSFLFNAIGIISFFWVVTVCILILTDKVEI